MLITDSVLGLCVAILKVGCEVVIKHVYGMDHCELCVLACPDGMIWGDKLLVSAMLLHHLE